MSNSPDCPTLHKWKSLPCRIAANWISRKPETACCLLIAAVFLSPIAVSHAQDTAGKPAAETTVKPAENAAADPAAAVAAEDAVKIDFTGEESGELPLDFMVSDVEAKFTIVDDGGNKLMRMSPSPLVDGGVMVGKSIKGGATVTARIRASGKRRSFPRFGVGLHGVSGYRLLAAPASKEIHLMRDDAVVAKVPLEWNSGIWTHFEFTITASADGGSAIEGRVWKEGQPRPATATLTYSDKTPPATGRASVWAAPYSSLPVDFDDITVTAKP